jgi:hypothetical protein
VNPPHSRVQRKVAMAGMQWADLKGPAFATAPGSQAVAAQATPDSNTESSAILPSASGTRVGRK